MPMQKSQNEYDKYSLPPREFTFPVFGRIQDRAPGLTIAQIDGLLREAWANGFTAGVQKVQPDLRTAIATAEMISDRTQRVIAEMLVPIANALLDQSVAKKTTIKAERDVNKSVCDSLLDAIKELRRIGN